MLAEAILLLAVAQPYDLLLRGGRVLDPRNGIDGVRDVAVADGTIAGADVSMLRVREGKFGFVDVSGGRNEGTRNLECELTLRAGKVVWDLNGIAASPDR